MGNQIQRLLNCDQFAIEAKLPQTIAQQTTHQEEQRQKIMVPKWFTIIITIITTMAKKSRPRSTGAMSSSQKPPGMKETIIDVDGPKKEKKSLFALVVKKLSLSN